MGAKDSMDWFKGTFTGNHTVMLWENPWSNWVRCLDKALSIMDFGYTATIEGISWGYSPEI